MRKALPVVVAVATLVTASVTATATVQADPTTHMDSDSSTGESPSNEGQETWDDEETGISPRWLVSNNGADARLRGLAAVSEDTAWVSGDEGTIMRTTDSAESWENAAPSIPDLEELDFRDIQAFDADHAIAMASGKGDSSRIYSTSDGGETWDESFNNTESSANYKCMAFFDDDNGIAMSDPVKGKIRFITTSDSGESWERLPDSDSPKALSGESAFNTSGQCLTTADDKNAYLATSSGETSRLWHTEDVGESWKSYETPIAADDTAGINALAFHDADHGIMVGGDYDSPNSESNAAAYTEEGATEFELADTPPGAYRSSVSYVAKDTAVTVGPTGSEFTTNDGKTWGHFDDVPFDTVDCVGDTSCWAAGPAGKTATLTLE